MRTVRAMILLAGLLVATAHGASATCCGIICGDDPSIVTCYTDVRTAMNCSTRGALECGGPATVFFLAGNCDDVGCTSVDGATSDSVTARSECRDPDWSLPPR